MQAKRKSSERVLPEAGTHIALLTQIIDWGTVTDSFGSRRKVEFVFELPESTHVFNEERGEEPLIVTTKCALTIGKGSALKDLIEGITGEDLSKADEYELETLLNRACQLQLALKESGEYTNVEIKSYMQLSKSDSKRKFKAHGEVLMLDLDNFDEETFKMLPEWKQKKIAESPEYKEAIEQAAKIAAKKPPVPAPKGKATPAKGGKGKLF